MISQEWSKLPHLAIVSSLHNISSLYLPTCILPLCVSFNRVGMTFASTHGENIKLENGGHSAHRFKGNSNRVVVTSAPLQSDKLFQVIL